MRQKNLFSNIRKSFAFLAFAAVAALPSFPEKTSLRVVCDVWVPYRIASATAPDVWSGIDFDLLRELARRLDFELVIMHIPWARSLGMIASGDADLMTGVAWSEERSKRMTYVPTSYSSVKPVLFAPANRGVTVRAYEDLAGKKIGQTANSVYFEPYNSDTSLDKVFLIDETAVLRMLTLGRLDVVVGTEPNISWDLARLGLRERVEPTVWQPDDKTPLYVVVSPRSDAAGLAGKIDSCIREILSDGTMQKIMDAYK